MYMDIRMYVEGSYTYNVVKFQQGYGITGVCVCVCVCVCVWLHTLE